ncbi:MAG: MATE family efflux transporter [Lachnospiraceae bacterium]|nr:MATE family efflux transporter [Lachnospiraceae bacterium]
MNKDLTVGNPEKVLWQFCLPLFGSIIFQQIYNIADSLVAGKLISEEALAAVGNSYEITLIFLAFAFGCNMGCSVTVARLFGAKKLGDMKTAVRTSMLATAVTCGILMLIGLLGGAGMLSLIHTPDNIYADSKLYLNIYVWGLPFVFFYNLANGIFSALGDSKTPFRFLAISSTANVFVDILFVKVFDMRVAGVAWATFLCQGVSCVVSIIVILRRLARIKTSETSRWFSLPIFKSFASVAIPTIFQQSFISIGNIVIQRIINGFGSGVIAGYSASIKLNNLVITSFTTIGNGISNYAAQNIGGGKIERINEGYKAGKKMVWILCIPMVLIYMIFSKGLVGFFMNEPSADALKTGVMFLRIVAPFYFIISVKLVADGNLRGAGLMKSFMIATFSDLILRVILAFVLSRTALGSMGIWCSWPLGWIVGCGLSVYFYRKHFKRAENILNK